MKKTIELHACLDCQFAHLMCSENRNPIVSECTITKEREVASVKRACRYFKPLIGEVEIHPMLPCK